MDQRLIALKEKVPLNSLSEGGFSQATGLFRIADAKAGEVLFSIGDKDGDSLYLLDGALSMTDPEGFESTIVGGSDRARYPLSNLKPRKYTAVVKSPAAVVARIASAQLDRVLTWDSVAAFGGETAGVVELVEAGDEGDWTRAVLSSREFARIPPVNLQRLFDTLDEVPVKKGQVVIRQGDPGDYFYIVKEGRCRVSRTVPGGEVALAELGPGDSFGEFALTARLPREANITMIEDGSLKRLAKSDFEALLVPPLIPSVTREQLLSMADQGFVPLDVRTEEEYALKSLQGAFNIPLYLLRMRMKKLKRGWKYLVFCDTGMRSSAATFLLNQRGFDAWLLEGGLDRFRSAR